MNKEKKIVITAFGNNNGPDRTIYRITLGMFDETSAKAYCANMNSLVLQGDAWIFSRIVSENIGYALDESLLLKFDCILGLDNWTIQKMLRELDSLDLAKALKGADEEIRNRIFENMSKRAIGILKEDMEYMGPVSLYDVMDKQEKILDIIRRSGEIVMPNVKGENAAGIAADESAENGSDSDKFNDSPIHLVRPDELDDDEFDDDEFDIDELDEDESDKDEPKKIEQKKCLNCGSALADGGEYCTHCGKYISREGFSPETGLTQFLNLDFLDREIEIFGERFKLDISKSEFYQRRALGYGLQKQYGEAVANYTRAMELEPENLNLYAARAEIYFRNSQYGEAVADYTRAMEGADDNFWFLQRRAAAHKGKGEFDKAIADSGKALEISPDDSDTWEFRAQIYEAAGEWQKAIRDCQKALEIDPYAFFAKKILARCWEKVNLKSDGNNNRE